MKVSHAKAIFIWGSVLSSILFLMLTYDSLSQLPHRTHEENLDAQVAAGKWVWQKYNCNDCHTILGIGGYYAPDVTRVMLSKDADWMKRFLKDPGAVWPADRKMPNLHLKDQEILDVISFLTWVNGIDTNNWPPKPLVVAASVSAKPGADIFKSQGCSACHMIGGVGGAVGPDLTKVGSRRDKEWIEEQLKNPKSHNPNSIMPSYAKLPEQDRKDLAEYLWELK
ncbi:MAG TPA: cytochrome c [Dissulfurispiraceae bacterium]|nr:cytochrome c [Dissulfurispiraceae bacterium]